jgi:hypothetical protein
MADEKEKRKERNWYAPKGKGRGRTYRLKVR